MGRPSYSMSTSPAEKRNTRKSSWRVFPGISTRTAYQGYHKLPGNIRVAGCWAHARRKFDEALNALPPDKREGTAALTELDYCNKLFAWEERFKDLSPEERTKQRLKEENCLIENMNPKRKKLFLQFVRNNAEFFNKADFELDE